MRAAHSNGHNLRKSALLYLRKIETGPLRHVQIRDNYIGCAFTNQQKSFEANLSFGNIVAGGLQQQGHAGTYRWIVIHNKNL